MEVQILSSQVRAIMLQLSTRRAASQTELAWFLRGEEGLTCALRWAAFTAAPFACIQFHSFTTMHIHFHFVPSTTKLQFSVEIVWEQMEKKTALVTDILLNYASQLQINVHRFVVVANT